MSFNLSETRKNGGTKRYRGGKGSSTRSKRSAAKKIQSKMRKHLSKRRKKRAATKLQTRARILKAKAIRSLEKEMADEIKWVRECGDAAHDFRQGRKYSDF